MHTPEAARVVELLIEQIDALYAEGRYLAAASAAERAVDAADQLDDANLRLRALWREASALMMSGDPSGSLARYTRILGMAEDPTVTAGLDALATRVIFRSYIYWVESARFAGGIPVRELFAVLDAADRWLIATGHTDWRAGVLLERSATHAELDEFDKAITAAQDALAAYNPDAPADYLASYRLQLGDALREAGQSGEAEPHYQAVLDDSPTSHHHSMAWLGLAWCALARDDPAAAVHHAQAAVQFAESHGGASLLAQLSGLVAAYRAAGELDAAKEAATRKLEIARRIGTHYRMYYALSDAVNIALDRGDHATATALLDELEQHAAALDTDRQSIFYSNQTAQQRDRLTDPDSPT